MIAVASFVTNMADNVMIGRLLGLSALGNYSLAFNIASAPIIVVVFSLVTVLFPAYAEITAEHPNTLELAFTKVFSIAWMMLLTITVPCFLLAGDIVHLLFGDRWTSAGTVLRVLALVIPLRGLSLIISTAFFLGLEQAKTRCGGKDRGSGGLSHRTLSTDQRIRIDRRSRAGMIAYGFTCVNRLIAFNKIIPGVSPKLLPISLSVLAAAGVGLLIASFSLTFVAPLPRIIFGGLISSIIPVLITLLVRADLRKWVKEWFS